MLFLNMSKKIVFAAGLMVVGLLLASCGSGSGGESLPVPDPTLPTPDPTLPLPPPPPPLPLFNGFSDVTRDEVAAFSSRAEYQNQPGLGMINAAYAYARGARNMAAGFGSGTGEGVTIGIFDSGLDTTHSSFNMQGKVDVASLLTYGWTSNNTFGFGITDITAPGTELENINSYPALGCRMPFLLFGECPPGDSFVISGSLFVQHLDEESMTSELRRLPTSAYREFARFADDMPLAANELVDGNQVVTVYIGELDHGTYVSSIAAGAQGGGANMPTHGVAYNAGIRFHAHSLGVPRPPRPGAERPPYRPGNPSSVGDAATIRDAVLFHNGAANVVNMSINYRSDPGTYQTNLFREQLSLRFSGVIDAMAQSDVAAADRTIYVVAAGNAHGRLLENGMMADASSPEFFAMLPLVDNRLMSQFLAVVSVDAQGDQVGQISSFSNRCGLAGSWCIAAPGGDVRGAYSTIYRLEGTPDPNFPDRDAPREATRLANGTSFAAPHVTGAIAVLIDFFGERLGHTEIVERLLATANKEGIYADQAIYGQGLLDLKAATEPVGMTSLLTGTSLSGPSVAASATRLLNGEAFGDAWANAFRAHALSVFDELDAPFPARLVDFVWSPARGLLFDAALSRLGHTALPHHRVLDNGVKLSFSSGAFLASGAVELGSLSDQRRWFASYGVHPGLAISSHIGRYSLSPTREDEFLAPWLGFATDGLSVGATLPFGALKLTVAGFDGYQTDEFADDRNAILSAALGDQGEDHRSHNQGFVLNLTSSGSSSWVGFQLGLVNEASGLVGSSGLGALKLGENMQTWFAGGTMSWTFRGWQTVASAYLGLTQADDEVQGSLFVDMSSLISSTMSFGVQRPDVFSRGDRFSLLITQPLRIESGDARLRFAVARTRYGDVILSETQADLVPSGREIELEASYFYPLSRSSKLTLAASLIRDRGHDAAAPLETRWMARWRLKF